MTRNVFRQPPYPAERFVTGIRPAWILSIYFKIIPFWFMHHYNWTGVPHSSSVSNILCERWGIPPAVRQDKEETCRSLLGSS
jgi:hypothetical protein